MPGQSKNLCGPGTLNPDCTALNSCDLGNLSITYSWSGAAFDLDTGTNVFGQGYGWSCGGSTNFVSYSGDNTKNGGSETVVINLTGSQKAGLWNKSLSIDLRAGWFAPAGGSGPATVTIAYNNKTITYQINPGVQSVCASTNVGTVTVSDDGTVSSNGQKIFGPCCKQTDGSPCIDGWANPAKYICNGNQINQQWASRKCDDKGVCQPTYSYEIAEDAKGNPVPPCSGAGDRYCSPNNNNNVIQPFNKCSPGSDHCINTEQVAKTCGCTPAGAGCTTGGSECTSICTAKCQDVGSSLQQTCLQDCMTGCNEQSGGESSGSITNFLSCTTCTGSDCGNPTLKALPGLSCGPLQKVCIPGAAFDLCIEIGGSCEMIGPGMPTCHYKTGPCMDCGNHCQSGDTSSNGCSGGTKTCGSGGKWGPCTGSCSPNGSTNTCADGTKQTCTNSSWSACNVGCPTGQTDPHKVCNTTTGVCGSESGCGTSSDCSKCCATGQTNSHKECQPDGTCKDVNTCGKSDDCTKCGCDPNDQPKNCPCGGESTCQPDGTWSPCPNKHLDCVKDATGNICKCVDGKGDDKCKAAGAQCSCCKFGDTSSCSCGGSKTCTQDGSWTACASHTVSQGGVCKCVSGSGADQCILGGSTSCDLAGTTRNCPCGGVSTCQLDSGGKLGWSGCPACSCLGCITGQTLACPCGGKQNCVNGEWTKCPDKHTDCLNGVCQCVDGLGANKCNVVGASCACTDNDTLACPCGGQQICVDGSWTKCPDKHTACVDGECACVDGVDDNECAVLGVPCNNTTCNSQGKCVSAIAGQGDGSGCSLGDICNDAACNSNGQCVPVAAGQGDGSNCTIGNVCNNTKCNSQGKCVSAIAGQGDGSGCSVGDACNNTTCNNQGQCVPATAGQGDGSECTIGNVCNNTKCNNQGKCVSTTAGKGDGFGCYVGDVCNNTTCNNQGQCVPVDAGQGDGSGCTVGNICNNTKCNNQGQCVPIDAGQGDGSNCTIGNICNNTTCNNQGQCVPATAGQGDGSGCAVGSICNNTTCNEDGQCVSVFPGQGDGSGCTAGNTCHLLNNLSPYAEGLTPVSADYCSYPLTGIPASGWASFRWNYKDPEDNLQASWQMQISTSSGTNFEKSIIYNSGLKTGAGNTVQLPVLLASTNPTTGQTGCAPNCSFINYNTAYYWRVKVSDGISAKTPVWTYYTNSGGFTYAWKHPAPWVLYSAPTSVLPGTEVSFTDNSRCYNDDGSSYDCKAVDSNTYAWVFGDGNTSSNPGSATNTYALPRTYTTKLTVCDSVGDSVGCCYAKLPLKVGTSKADQIPQWSEITPFQ